MVLTCFRCGGELPPDADSTLTYCNHCGAAQLFLSEELAQKTAEAQRAYTEENADPDRAQNVPARPSDPTAIMWKAAVRCVALTAGVMALLTMLQALAPAVGFFAALWLIASPMVALGVYHSRYPDSRITGSFGARVGLLTGLAGLAVIAVLSVVQIDLARHAGRMADFDTMWPLLMQKTAAQAAANGAVDAGLIAMFLKPDFHVGWFLLVLGMMAFLLLMLTTAGGAFAGLMRSKQLKPSR